MVKKLTKKLKDFNVEITFAESKEFNAVKQNLMEPISDNITGGNPASGKPVKRRKRNKTLSGRKNRLKE